MDHVKIVVKLCREILRRVTRSVFFFLLTVCSNLNNFAQVAIKSTREKHYQKFNNSSPN